MNSTSDTESREPADQPSVPARAGFGTAFAILGAVYVGGLVLQHILNGMGAFKSINSHVVAVAIGFLSFAITLIVGFEKKVHRFLASNRFAVPLILSLTVLSILGTLILQGQPDATLRRAYGSAYGPIRALFLDDVFHCLGFGAMMGLGAGGLALVVCRKRRLTLRYAGSVGAHLGILILLLGASIGKVWGMKGVLTLHVGETSDQYFVTGEGETDQAALPLGFTLGLDDFRLLHYKTEFRLMVFDVSKKPPARLISVDPAGPELASLKPYQVEVLNYWPDYMQETVVEPLPPTDGNSALPGSVPLAAMSLIPSGAQTVDWVFDDGGEAGGRWGHESLSLAFFWDAERATRFFHTQTKKPAALNRLVVQGNEMSVEVGKSYPLPGSDRVVTVLQVLTDFMLDESNKRALNRSDQPNNPAVELALKDASGAELARGWLFAKHPDFHMQKKSPLAGIGFRHGDQGGQNQVSGIVVGEVGEYWALANGVVQRKDKLELNKPLALSGGSVVIQAVHRAVKRSFKNTTRSKEANNAVVQLKVFDGAAQMLPINQPINLDKDTVLGLTQKEGESVRDYLSVLSVIENGQKVLTKTIEVNVPLHYGGLSFYQNDYRPDDPTFSGFQVVKDPGVWLVYLGLLLNAAGVICSLLIHPMTKRKRSPQGSGGEPS